MTHTTPSIRRRSTAAAATAMALFAGAVLTAPTAALAAEPGPVYRELNLDQGINTWTTTSHCSPGPETVTASPATTMGDNGTATVTASRSQTFSGVAAAPESTEVSIGQRATAGSRTRAGLPAELRLDFAGQARAVATPPDASCTGVAASEATLDYAFAIDRPLWATLSYVKKGSTYSEIYLRSTARDSQPYEDLYGQMFKGSGSTTVLLQPGEYAGLMQGGISLPQGTGSRSVTGSGTLRISFAEPGSAIAAPAGAAKSHVSLAAARSCAAHGLAGRLTGSAKRLKTIAKVTFSVNGKTVKSLKRSQLRRGLVVRLPIPDEAAASVRASVKLRTGKTLTLNAAYRPCG